MEATLLPDIAPSITLEPSYAAKINEVTQTAPGTLKLIKRNAQVVPYDPSKIEVAMTKAFLAVEGGHAAESSRIHQLVRELTTYITQAFHRRMPGGGDCPY